MASIVVADDDAVSLQVLQHILKHLGHEVMPCEDGVQAYGHFNDNPHRWQLLVTDIAMPGMDGVTVCQALRNELHLSVPVIAVTTYESHLFNAELVETFDAWLVKPVVRSVLSAAIDCLLWGKNMSLPGAPRR
ncbi:MAG: response regulator [Planctomycetota bacterium]|nr:MAG: response regulator [Planctomycetota bacterium]